MKSATHLFYSLSRHQMDLNHKKSCNEKYDVAQIFIGLVPIWILHIPSVAVSLLIFQIEHSLDPEIPKNIGNIVKNGTHTLSWLYSLFILKIQFSLFQL